MRGQALKNTVLIHGDALKKYAAKNPWDLVLTIVWLSLVYICLFPLWKWAVVHAIWTGSVDACNGQGACWIYVGENWNNLFYGAMPRNAIWRLHSVLMLMFAWIIVIWQWRSRLWPLLSFCVGIPLAIWLVLHGGYFGLRVIPSQYWGGFSLNIIISILSIALAFPLSIVLVLAGRSSLWVLRTITRSVIAFFIGIPLVVHLFFATLVLPLFITEGYVPDKFIRVVSILSLFGASYMAEVLRGGLQSVTKAQFEACDSLGLSYWQTMAYVILPQAIQAVFPGLVNLVIALFKDSVLVSTIALLDVVAMMQTTLANMKWMPYFIEGYLFVGGVFWVICFGASQCARYLETQVEIRR